MNCYLSFHENDAAVVQALRGQLNTLLQAGEMTFSDYTTVPKDVKTAEFTRSAVEDADLILIFCSADYFNREETILESRYARNSPRRPLIIPLRARAVAATPDLEAYQLVPADGLPLSNEGRINDVQCALSARAILERVKAFREHYAPVPVAMVDALPWEEARIRLLSFLDKNDLRATLRLLRQLVTDPALDKIVFEARENYQQLHRRTRQELQPVDAFLEALEQMRTDIRQLMLRLEPAHVRSDWQALMEAEYFGLRPIQKPQTVMPGLSMPSEAIATPDTYRGAEEGAPPHPLAPDRQQEFRRLFILAQDAQGFGQYGKAHALAEQIRTTLYPESAQLYELLLVTLVQHESPDRIVREYLQGRTRLIDRVIHYANRFREFQAGGKCPSTTGAYNLAEVASVLHNGIRRAYADLPNDFILDTGLNASRYPDARQEVLQSLHLATDMYHFIHPAEGFLELACTEFCGGGKYQWAESIQVREDGFHLVNRREFDLLSEINHLQTLLLDPPATPFRRHAPTHYEPREILRGNLLIALRRKRAGLIAAIEEERRFYREFIDERESLVQFVYACITSYLAFDSFRGEKSAFLGMALDELLRKPEVPWFTLDKQGRLAPHPDCARLQFPVVAITETLLRHYSGLKNQEQISALIRETVFEQFRDTTEALYERVVKGLSWKDIRRLRDDAARQLLIECMERWEILYRADPVRGEPYLLKAVEELMGNGFYTWMQFSPEQLVSHPDSLALGYDAVAALQRLQRFPLPWSPAHIEKVLVDRIFLRHIEPAYAALTPGKEANRPVIIGLILQVLRCYRSDPQPVFLDWIYRELCEEQKLRWIDIDTAGRWIPFPVVPAEFQPTALLEQLTRLEQSRFKLFEVRRRIAQNRYAELKAQFYREISEFQHENKLPEREIAIRIFQRIKGVFKFFPDREFLELPLQELFGPGRIRWQARFLGVFTVPENHHENNLLHFDYKAERAEFLMYRDNLQEWLTQMLREIEPAIQSADNRDLARR